MKRSEKSRKASRVDANKAKQAVPGPGNPGTHPDGAGLHVHQPVPGPGTTPADGRGDTVL